MKKSKGPQNSKPSAPTGTKPMPRVGGHTSNVTPSQGVKTGGSGC